MSANNSIKNGSGSLEEELGNLQIGGNEGANDLKSFLAQYQAQRDAGVQKVLNDIDERKQNVNLRQQGPRRFDRTNVPRAIKKQTKELPIYKEKERLIETIRNNQTVIVMGETGSGKSTQIPQYLVEAGFADTGKIGVTQPRKVAAKSLAQRVAKECGVAVGSLVGYAVRFDKQVGGDTMIKYMTDGLLVKECTMEQNLESYSVIIIDEAHERSIPTDVCFGLLKRAARNRPDLKIIISSATLEEDKFSKFFNNAPVFKVPGRTFGVGFVYEPYSETDYIQGAVNTILKIHRREPKGDVLVFLAGQDEIDFVWDLLDNNMTTQNIPHSELEIMPCYGALAFEDQQKIFESASPGVRKVILATNIAETSITIDGIVYVVDSGYFKQNEYNPKTGISSLIKKEITKFQAIQRAGRAGRTQAGKCYRLYSEPKFNSFGRANVPEIKRCNIESVVLDLIAMGITNPMNFEFLDQPTPECICEALEHLKELNALDASYGLTQLGRQMSQFPLDPPLARVVLESGKLGCSAETIKIVAVLSANYQKLFIQNKRKRTQIDQARAHFNQPDGDHLTYLNIFEAWELTDHAEWWCKNNCIQFRTLCEAEEIRIQLQDILISHRQGIPERYCAQTVLSENIRRAFTSGYFRQIAQKKPKGHSYRTLGDISTINDVFVHPTSSLFKQIPEPPYMIYHDVVRTTKAFMRGSMIIQPSWVREYAPEFIGKLSKWGIVLH